MLHKKAGQHIESIMGMCPSGARVCREGRVLASLYILRSCRRRWSAIKKLVRKLGLRGGQSASLDFSRALGLRCKTLHKQDGSACVRACVCVCVCVCVRERERGGERERETHRHTQREGERFFCGIGFLNFHSWCNKRCLPEGRGG
jgi:hypothetical protein